MTPTRSHLISSIVADFSPRHTARPRVLLPGRKLDRESLSALGIPQRASVALPDVVIHDLERDWLFLMDAVRGKHPIDEIRREQLSAHFSGTGKHLVLFSVFSDGGTYARCAESIAWETNVWIADTPDHMIHYNGERFLGPYS
jgi:hypothetical protein